MAQACRSIRLGDVAPSERLLNATIGDQFYYRYPLGFELEDRKQPFFDPGRVRNDRFFRALYFERPGNAAQVPGLGYLSREMR